MRYLSILFFCFQIWSCRDDLPVYSEPQNIFEGSLIGRDSSAIQYYTTEPLYFLGDKAVVAYREYGNDWDFIVGIRETGEPGPAGSPLIFLAVYGIENIYEETIQSRADVQGTFEIWPADYEHAGKYTFPLTNQILEGSPLYSPGVNVLTINPGEKLYLYMRWDFLLNNGKWIHEAQNPVIESGLGGRWMRLEYNPFKMKMRLSVSLFKNSKAIVIENEFTMTIVGKRIFILP